MGQIELDYCDRCGVPIPAECLRDRGGFMLCPPCFKEPEADYDIPFDLFEEIATATKPENNE